MQDIDFDELDRAVNSVISDGAAPTPEHEAPEVKREVDIPERSHISRPTVSPAARRSSGRFMDVVHPSSDMRPKGAAAPAPAPSRSAEPVTPPTPTPAPAPAETTPSDDFKWPDPLDVAANPETPKVEAPVAAEAAAEPLETPFLTDTKVEKRPLGAFSDSKPALDLTDVLNEDHEEAPAPAAEVEEPATVPPDAPTIDSIDETALEASEESLIGSPESSDTQPDAQPKPAAEPEKPAEAPKEEKPAESYDPPASATLGAASIPQQYKEQPSTTDQPSGAIYDTEAYHQPLAHPQKKKSGLLVIVWILVLLVLGGGLGAALYFYVLPML